MLEVKNIIKSFNQHSVLKGLSFTIDKGTVYGLVGENGAGKTTLLKIISQLLTKDSGEIYINGQKIENIDDIVGKLVLILDIPSMFEYLTCEEYMRFLLSPQNLSKECEDLKISENLAVVELEVHKNKRIQTLSRGMRQKFGIACALLSDPDIILMDEPCSALDPIGRSEVLGIIEKLKNKNKTVVLSTHILSDVEKICDKVGLLINGVIRVEGSIEDVMRKFSENAFKVSCKLSDVESLVKFVSRSEFYQNCNVEKYGVDIYFKPEGKAEILKNIADSGIDVDSIVLKKASIEEVFVKARGDENV